MTNRTLLLILLIPSLPNPSHAVQVGSLTWVLVDTMNNCYSMLSNSVSPLDYDPVTGYVGIVHRAKTSYGTGSGQLWYNMSPDGMTGWSRIASLNGDGQISSRYPSGVVTQSRGFCSSATNLNPGSFGNTMIFGCGDGYTLHVPDDNTLWSTSRLVVDTDSPAHWVAVSHDPNVPNSHNSAVHLWRITGSVTEFDVWDLSLFQVRGLDIGLCYRNGVLYLGGYASLLGDPNEVRNIFYSKSTDDGATWTQPDGPNIGVGDWRTLPAIAASPYDDWEIHGAFDMLVDNFGHVHFFGVLEDTNDQSANLAVVDIYETASGWDAQFVAENLAASTLTNYGSVDQMGFHVGASISADGMAMAAAWLSAAAPADTLPDIWVSTRHVAGEMWSEPVNLTNTPDYAELLPQVAPGLRNDGDDAYTMFIARAYEQWTSAYPPNDVAATDIFVAAVPLTISTTDVSAEPERPLAYGLSQNYPNPFNAQTRISYTVGSPQSVVLSVFDLLGREIATLVNERKAAGTHTVTWDAAGLPSGVYYYRLQAGSYVESKKLVLIR